MVIVGGHVVVQFFPSAVAYLALIPARYFYLQITLLIVLSQLIIALFIRYSLCNLNFLR